jgi:outer membrane protein OmpA-like peptidoglycan-associated protein
MFRRFLTALMTVLAVLSLGSLAIGQTAATPEQNPFNPWPSTSGLTGFWNVLSADTAKAGSFGISGWLDRTNRNPGQLTITSAGTGFFFSPSDRFELGVQVNFGNRILARRLDELGLGQATLNSLGYAGCGGCAPLRGPVSMPGYMIPQLRDPLDNLLTGRTGYDPQYPWVNRRLQSGVGDVVVGAKINLASQDKGSEVSFAIHPWIAIPTVYHSQDLLNTGAQTGSAYGGLDLLLSKNIGFAALHFNLGYEYLAAAKYVGGQLLATTTVVGPAGPQLIGATHIVPIKVAINVPRSTRVQAIVEGTSDAILNQGTPNSSYGATSAIDVTAGFRFFLTHWLALEAGYRANVTQVAGDKNGFHFAISAAHRPEPPPPVLTDQITASCQATPASFVEGSVTSVRLSASATSQQGRALTYSWSSSGGSISGQGSTATLDTAGLKAGHVNVTVTANTTPPPATGSGSCAVDIQAAPARNPPTCSVSSDSTTVTQGGAVNFSVRGSSPDNRSLSYSWSGAVSGSGQSKRLDTSSLSAGAYTANVTVSDDRGLTGQCSASTQVVAPPPQPKAQLLGTCSFTLETNVANPTRVNNECKNVLDTVAQQIKDSPGGTAVLVGYSGLVCPAPAKGKKKQPADIGAQRAANVKDYLTKEKGLSTSFEIRSVQDGDPAVKLYLVPRGAKYSDEGSVATEPSAEPRVKIHAPKDKPAVCKAAPKAKAPVKEKSAPKMEDKK